MSKRGVISLKLALLLVILFFILGSLIYYSIAANIDLSNRGGYETKSSESTEENENHAIVVKKYVVEPEKFKVGGYSRLILGIKNNLDRRLNITIYFETHSNVKLYIGDSELDKVGRNYTFTLIMEPREYREIPFKLSASLDIGDYERGYYIKAFIYMEEKYITTVETIFKVLRD